MLLFIFFSVVCCSQKTFLEKKIFLGQEISAAILNKGEIVYKQNCQSCHGLHGDGLGVTGKILNPQPRNFTQGIFKFGTTSGLPTDQDLFNIIQQGIRGTAMLPWSLTPQDLYSVTQYIKTFSSAWEGSPPEKIQFIEDPYGPSKKKFAIEKGKELYHTVTNCMICHKSYVSKEEYKTLLEGEDSSLANQPDFFFEKIQETEYYTFNKTTPQKSLPPDFTLHQLRFLHIEKTLEEAIYRRLAVGVTGGSMPPWKDLIPDTEIYAIAYYVADLISQGVQ